MPGVGRNGSAWLFKGDTEQGTKYIQDAINADISKRYLYMHCTYHILSVQQNPGARDKHLEDAENLQPLT